MRKRVGHTNLFMTELFFAIIIFTLVCAICLNVFAKAHSLSEKSYQLENATYHLANCAELYRGSDDNSSFKEELGKTYQLTEDNNTLTLDIDGAALEIILENNSAEFSYSCNNEVIGELSVKKGDK